MQDPEASFTCGRYGGDKNGWGCNVSRLIKILHFYGFESESSKHWIYNLHFLASNCSDLDTVSLEVYGSIPCYEVRMGEYETWEHIK